MVTIRVLGTGLIPRGLGIAPRMTPTKAGLSLIQLIIATKNMKVEMKKPDGSWVELTKVNVVKLYNQYDGVDVDNAPVKNVSKPTAPAPKFAQATSAKPVETTPVNESVTKQDTKADDKTVTTQKDGNSADVTIDSKDEKTDKNSNSFKVISNPKDQKK